MTLLVGVDNLSGGATNDLNPNALWGYTTGYAAVATGTVTQLRCQIASINSATQAIMVLTDMEGSIVARTATFTPQVGWNNIDVSVGGTVTQGVSYIPRLFINGYLFPVSGTGEWEVSDFAATFPTVPETIDPEGDAWTGNHAAFNIYAEGTTGGGTVNTETLSSAVTLSDSGSQFAIRGRTTVDSIALADSAIADEITAPVAIIRETLIDNTGTPVANATGITVLLWEGTVPDGAPDQVLTGQATNGSGETEWVFARGSLEEDDPVFYVAYLGDPPTAQTARPFTPDYE